MAKSVFHFDGYKPFMAAMLTGKGCRGQLTRAAEALNCQRSYLSRVIAENLHITPDHAFNLARFWRLSLEERTYFQTLVEHDRAASPTYRNHLKAQLAELKRKHESIQERTQRTGLSIDALQANYFSTWIWSAIHFLTSIPTYQTLEAISDRLGLKQESTLHFLEELRAQGFIESQGSRWVYKTGAFHAPKDSPLVILHHQNWRGRALGDAQDFGNDSIHYTGVHTLSRADLKRLRELLLTFISEANQMIEPSKPEEAIAFTCDLFRV